MSDLASTPAPTDQPTPATPSPETACDTSMPESVQDTEPVRIQIGPLDV